MEGLNRRADSFGNPPTSVAMKSTDAACDVSHNLVGQRLGRKGRVTRERILAATQELLECPDAGPITLSAVARKASLGMTSLYNYFTDLTELLLEILEPAMATAESYLAILREPWSDEELADRCVEFVQAYQAFWVRHSRLLHMRNAMADHYDRRMMIHRIDSTKPIIELLVKQMGGKVSVGSPATSMATMVMIGIERTITLVTDNELPKLVQLDMDSNVERFTDPGARLMELAIRDVRMRRCD